LDDCRCIGLFLCSVLPPFLSRLPFGHPPSPRGRVCTPTAPCTIYRTIHETPAIPSPEDAALCNIPGGGVVGGGLPPQQQICTTDMSFRGPLGPWESPGTMFVSADSIGELYQEIATAPLGLRNDIFFTLCVNSFNDHLPSNSGWICLPIRACVRVSGRSPKSATRLVGLFMASSCPKGTK